MSNYRLEFDSITGPKDTDRLYYLLSIVSRDDELEITMDNDDAQDANTIIGVLRQNEFDVSKRRDNEDGKYHLLARRK